MKKILCGLVTSLFLFTSVFAEGNFFEDFKSKYSGDVQVQMGYAGAIQKTSYDKSTYEYNINFFNMAIQSWNFYSINDLIGVGVQGGISFGFGKLGKITQKMGSEAVTVKGSDLPDISASFCNFEFGPAVGFSIKDSVKINGGLGLAIACDLQLNDKDSKTKDGISPAGGFYMDFQGKFLPKGKFSPVVGYRFETNKVFKKYTANKDTKVISEVDSKVKMNDFINTIYVGCAYNW